MIVKGFYLKGTCKFESENCISNPCNNLVQYLKRIEDCSIPSKTRYMGVRAKIKLIEVLKIKKLPGINKQIIMDNLFVFKIS